MNNKEAIKVIKSNWPPSNFSMLIEALTLAIKSLDDSDSVEKGNAVSFRLPDGSAGSFPLKPTEEL